MAFIISSFLSEGARIISISFSGTMFIPTLAGMQEDIVKQRASDLSSLYYYMSDENIMKN